MFILFLCMLCISIVLQSCQPSTTLSIQSILNTSLATAIKMKTKELDELAGSSSLPHEKRISSMRKTGNILELPLSQTQSNLCLSDFFRQQLPDYREINDEKIKNNALAILLLLGLQPKEKGNIKSPLILNLQGHNLQSLEGLSFLYTILKGKNYLIEEIDISNNNLKEITFNHTMMPSVKYIDARNNQINTTNIQAINTTSAFTLDISYNPLKTSSYRALCAQFFKNNSLPQPAVYKTFPALTAATLCFVIGLAGGILAKPFSWLRISATPLRQWFNKWMAIGDAIGSAPYAIYKAHNTLIFGKPQQLDANYYHVRRYFIAAGDYLD